MNKHFKYFFQIMFFCLFVILAIIGKMQVWMIVFTVSLIAALLFGRFYCGWICPINTGIELIDKIFKRFNIKRKEVPLWIKNPYVRYLMLSLFILTFVIVKVTGKELPVLPALFFIGILLSALFVPSLWHRYLCPYGTLLNSTGFLARKFYRVEDSNCVKCGVCKKVCPAEAIEMESRAVFPKIKPGLCLVCSNCADACPKKTIFYR